MRPNVPDSYRPVKVTTSGIAILFTKQNGYANLLQKRDLSTQEKCNNSMICVRSRLSSDAIYSMPAITRATKCL